jgi:hypothetical protein
MSEHDDDLPTAQPDESDENALALFDEEASARIRRVMHEGQWFYSIIDVVGLLTDNPKPRQYWFDMKRNVHAEGFVEVSEKIRQLKLPSRDGKLRETDCADEETLLRLIQSVPSPKAEPLKQWLARVGTERLQEMEDPEIAAKRMRKEFERKGYSDAWINERLKNVVIRNELTDEWRERGAEEGREFALLTDILSKETFDKTTAEHRQFKHLRQNANLRNSMTPMELVLTPLAELTATGTHQTRDSKGFTDLQRDAHDAGALAGNTRREVEELTGKQVVSPTNFKELQKERQRELQPSLFGEESADDTDNTDDASGESGSGEGGAE